MPERMSKVKLTTSGSYENIGGERYIVSFRFFFFFFFFFENLVRNPNTLYLFLTLLF